MSGSRGRLIVLGASARAAACSAARGGFGPYAIDLFADSDLAALCRAVRIERYPGGFFRALAAAPQAPWMYTGGLENYPRLVARLAAMRPLLGNGADSLRTIRDPLRLHQQLRAAGFACPDLSTGNAEAGRAWLVKPRRGSAGLGVRLAIGDELRQAPRGAVLQGYVDGESCSATYVAAGGRAALLGATRQIIGRDWGLAPDFLYVGSLGPLPLAEHEHDALVRLGHALANRFGLAGLFGVDFIRTADDVWPVEVNPRYTASVEVLERVTGRNFVGDHVAACAYGKLPDITGPASGRCAGKAVVYARREGVWRASPVAEIADVPRPGDRIRARQPVATVFASGDSLPVVEQGLRVHEAAVLAALGPSPHFPQVGEKCAQCVDQQA